jgi:hypothetical protein
MKKKNLVGREDFTKDGKLDSSVKISHQQNGKVTRTNDMMKEKTTRI